MYEQTPLSRGESLDPNPLGQGEYIEEKHSHITCSNRLHSFPMLRVRLLHLSPQQINTVSIMLFIFSEQHPVILVFGFFSSQKANVSVHSVSSPAEGGMLVRNIKVVGF